MAWLSKLSPPLPQRAVRCVLNYHHRSIGTHLDAWLAQVESSNLPELQSFAAGIEKDKDAVRNGLTWQWSNGMVEGNMTKLKLIKRQGYGRAGFPLLRKRVLHAL